MANDPDNLYLALNTVFININEPNKEVKLKFNIGSK